MDVNRNYIERSEGAKLLVEFCENMADELNIELTKEPQWVLAVKDEAQLGDYCQLIIASTTDSTMVSISREEIEDYPAHVGHHTLENKIKNKLKPLKLN